MEELKKKEGEKKGREERNVYQLKKWDSSHGQLPPSPSSACDIFAHPICDTISLLINKTWTKSQNQFCSYLIERNTSNKDIDWISSEHILRETPHAGEMIILKGVNRDEIQWGRSLFGHLILILRHPHPEWLRGVIAEIKVVHCMPSVLKKTELIS